MLKYNPANKQFSQKLRANQTDTERILWSKLRRKQIKGYLFTRQKPIGRYIVDFYCHKLKLVIEVDGDLHYLTEKNKIKDRERDQYLNNLGITVYRINNIDVYKNLKEVMQGIWNLVRKLENKT